MSVKKQELADVLAAIESLRTELAALSERVQKLEINSNTAIATAPKQGAQESVPLLPEVLIATISAAIAAYLGKKPHIRQIRLVGSSSWSEQGRVSIQASHMLSMPPRH
jgi:methylmalonyl-CoA carboxyltransferase large subunit